MEDANEPTNTTSNHIQPTPTYKNLKPTLTHLQPPPAASNQPAGGILQTILHIFQADRLNPCSSKNSTSVYRLSKNNSLTTEEMPILVTHEFTMIHHDYSLITHFSDPQSFSIHPTTGVVTPSASYSTVSKWTTTQC